GSASTPSSDPAADDPPPRTEEHGHRMNENPSTDPAGTDPGDQAALLAEIDAELAAERSSTPRPGQRLTGLVLLTGALIGWIASLDVQVGALFLPSNRGVS